MPCVHTRHNVRCRAWNETARSKPEPCGLAYKTLNSNEIGYDKRAACLTLRQDSLFDEYLSINLCWMCTASMRLVQKNSCHSHGRCVVFRFLLLNQPISSGFLGFVVPHASTQKKKGEILGCAATNTQQSKGVTNEQIMMTMPHDSLCDGIVRSMNIFP